MTKKLNAGEYKELDEFVKDARLVFGNCKIYNAASTEYYKCAVQLQDFFNARLHEMGLVPGI